MRIPSVRDFSQVTASSSRILSFLPRNVTWRKMSICLTWKIITAETLKLLWVRSLSIASQNRGTPLRVSNLPKNTTSLIVEVRMPASFIFSISMPGRVNGFWCTNVLVGIFHSSCSIHCNNEKLGLKGRVRIDAVLVGVDYLTTTSASSTLFFSKKYLHY